MNASNLDVQYTASATSMGGRQGQVTTSDGNLSLRTTEPKELGGKGEQGATNPEQLFAAGYASCFSSAAKLAAETMNLPLKEDDLEVTCHVSYGRDKSSTGFGLKVKMEVSANGLEQDAMHRLLEKANEICPYSKAIKGNVEVELVSK